MKQVKRLSGHEEKMEELMDAAAEYAEAAFNEGQTLDQALTTAETETSLTGQPLQMAQMAIRYTYAKVS